MTSITKRTQRDYSLAFKLFVVELTCPEEWRVNRALIFSHLSINKESVYLALMVSKSSQ